MINNIAKASRDTKLQQSERVTEKRRYRVIEMGVEKQVIRPGTGPKPAPGQTVTVHCTGFGNFIETFLCIYFPDNENRSIQICLGEELFDVIIFVCFLCGEMDGFNLN